MIVRAIPTGSCPLGIKTDRSHASSVIFLSAYHAIEKGLSLLPEKHREAIETMLKEGLALIREELEGFTNSKSLQ